jgi:hypothetical protein
LLKKSSLLLSSLKWTIARPRSRIGWLKEGDANTKLFHMHARHWKRKNFIVKLTSQGEVFTSHEDKANLVQEFYGSLLGSRLNREHSIDLQALGIPTHDLIALDLPLSEEEVWDTIKNLPLDKPPRSDGFTGGFYKSCWTLIKHDIMAGVSVVWSGKFLNFDKVNSAFITLIPKMVGAD